MDENPYRAPQQTRQRDAAPRNRRLYSPIIGAIWGGFVGGFIGALPVPSLVVIADVREYWEYAKDDNLGLYSVINVLIEYALPISVILAIVGAVVGAAIVMAARWRRSSNR